MVNGEGEYLNPRISHEPTSASRSVPTHREVWKEMMLSDPFNDVAKAWSNGYLHPSVSSQTSYIA